MIVDCGVYQDGVRDGTAPLHGVLAGAQQCEGFVWIGLLDPSDQELSDVAEEFKLHELLVEDATKAHQRAKLERYDDAHFVVLKAAAYVEPDRIEMGEVQVILGAHFVITVRHGPVAALGSVRETLEGQPKLLALGPAAVLHAVADHLVDEFSPVIEELEADVDEAELEIFGDRRANPAERIFGLKRSVLDLLRNLLPMVDVLEELQQPSPLLPTELRDYFRDVSDHIRRVLGRAEMVRDLLSDALHANLAQISVRQNDDMRTISGWAALIAAPTLLAGIWGMNFSQMPELRWNIGYPGAIGLMLIVVLLLFRRFRRSGWL